MAAELDGPRLSPQSGTARQLVVFLHGYGADGNDLIEIGRYWQQFLPHAAFVSPHAPEPCGQAPIGRQWFALTFRDPNERWVGVNHAAPGLERFIDAELARHRLPPSALALVGFSQGTMMSLHVGLRRAAAPAAIVGYSGLSVLPPDGKPETLAAESGRVSAGAAVYGDRDELIRRSAVRGNARARGTRRAGRWHCRPASATASIPRVCATAANSWREASRTAADAMPARRLHHFGDRYPTRHVGVELAVSRRFPGLRPCSGGSAGIMTSQSPLRAVAVCVTKSAFRIVSPT